MDAMLHMIAPVVATCAVATFLFAYLEAEKERQRKSRKPRSVWIKPFLARKGHSDRNTILKLYQELIDDGEIDHLTRSLRMPPDVYQELLEIIRPSIQKQHTNFRKPITPEERLCITLRYIALGDSLWSIQEQFRVGYSTINGIITETCQALYDRLRPKYLQVPRTRQAWQAVADRFLTLWDLPNVIGAVDGKHVRIACPPKSGSLYFNYKHFFSIIMMAVVDADYKFMYIDVGAEGKCSDGGVWRRCSFNNMISRPSNPLNIPLPRPLPGMRQRVPYFLVGDDAFPLTTSLMKPYGIRRLTDKELIYNYRISRGRRIVENAFGILCAKFAIFRRELKMHPDRVVQVVLACVVLHNYMRVKCPSNYMPPGSTDWEDDNHQLHNGQWRQLVKKMRGLPRITGNYYRAAKVMRDDLATWFVSPAGEIPWQYDAVRLPQH